MFITYILRAIFFAVSKESYTVIEALYLQVDSIDKRHDEKILLKKKLLYVALHLRNIRCRFSQQLYKVNHILSINHNVQLNIFLVQTTKILDSTLAVGRNNNAQKQINQSTSQPINNSQQNMRITIQKQETYGKKNRTFNLAVWFDFRQFFVLVRDDQSG